VTTENAVSADPHAIFADCCDPNETRCSIEKPFIQAMGEHEYLWATDGSIMVRRRVSREWPPNPIRYVIGDRRVPLCSKAWPRDNIKYKQFPIPTGISGTVSCEMCSTMGRPQNRKHSCHECDGKGTWRNRKRVQIGRLGFQAYYIALLAKHGTTELGIPTRGYKIPARFVLGEIEGVLMPLSSIFNRKARQPK
jgi:hypothetical protein